MTERYNVQASTILGDNYKITNIECSDYNPTIDDNITVTITVNDVYGDAISGESVTVTANEGNFTQLNGSNITNDSTVTGTTNSSGQFTLTYNCTEWGLITFSANNTNIQANVIGFKSQDMWHGTLYYNDTEAQLVLNFSGSGTYSTSGSWTDSQAFDTVPSGLRPLTSVYSALSSQYIRVRVTTSGVVQYQTTQSVSDPYFQCVLTWYLP